jgi:hypothetical protein
MKLILCGRVVLFDVKRRRWDKSNEINSDGLILNIASAIVNSGRVNGHTSRISRKTFEIRR